ncbi:hypothetical protein [Franconibacter helveticus]|uniref:ComEC/Rec2 family competence protein n=1 Tax=Franconibacter helveticus TaxID=357240 RepID=UPI002909C0EF|nr:hypothetical protein [Franconibacter helveticus]MDU6925954.1 hypothetical protein [Franconibacter helveticus]
MLECHFYALPAGQGDCLVIQFQGDDGGYHNILIDGGNRNQLEFNIQKRILISIIDNGNKGIFDLVIVTHSDDDHISGILKIMGDSDLEPLVKELWFNSEKTINYFFNTKCKNTQKYNLEGKNIGSNKSSRAQDNNLYTLLNKGNKWNKRIIMSGMSEKIDNLTINVLSPTKDKLFALNKYWPKQKLGPVKSSGEHGYDYKTSLREFYEQMDNFKEDNSVVNGASIALSIEWKGRRFLLLSDAHPTIIAASIKDLYGVEKTTFDIVKMSHHGSAKNINNDLLSLISCRDFVVSADANKRHFHPNKEALSRVLFNNGIKNTIFHFTYDKEELRNIFLSEPDVMVRFPCNKNDGVHLSYEY